MRRGEQCPRYHPWFVTSFTAYIGAFRFALPIGQKRSQTMFRAFFAPLSSYRGSLWRMRARTLPFIAYRFIIQFFKRLSTYNLRRGRVWRCGGTRLVNGRRKPHPKRRTCERQAFVHQPRTASGRGACRWQYRVNLIHARVSVSILARKQPAAVKSARVSPCERCPC